jgi:hypothetical protein
VAFFFFFFLSHDVLSRIKHTIKWLRFQERCGIDDKKHCGIDDKNKIPGKMVPHAKTLSCNRHKQIPRTSSSLTFYYIVDYLVLVENELKTSHQHFGKEMPFSNK